MICVPITEDNVEDAVKTANSIDCDIVEIRLDYLEDASKIDFLAKIKKPKIATCMPKWEGGRFGGGEEERIDILLSAIDFCQYVSIELGTSEKLRGDVVKKAKEKGVKVIVSYHDFKSTPSRDEIIKILKDEETAGADIAKAAFIPESASDVRKIMSVIGDKHIWIPVIVIAMGELGRMSRARSLLMGSYLTFASSGKGKESAPGQMSVQEIRETLKWLKK
ncbi:MAG: type I 3-dehydroquinate dehydratase [Candidatus Altiarchaeales archaeon IMC4]|nr:MAG: type I 3-dehydroquinate dehydratase [Candidatus Altiarchaeales archaeon IMC4]